MKKSRYSDSQIISILKQAEAGAPMPPLALSRQQILDTIQLKQNGYLQIANTRYNTETNGDLRIQIFSSELKTCM